jgi:hypothetical protein
MGLLPIMGNRPRQLRRLGKAMNKTIVLRQALSHRMRSNMEEFRRLHHIELDHGHYSPITRIKATRKRKDCEKRHQILRELYKDTFPKTIKRLVMDTKGIRWKQHEKP